MNKTAFAISVALTTFILVAVAGIVIAVRAADKPVSAVAPATATMETAVPVDPAVEAAGDPNQALLQTFSEREAKYQELIAEANARLEKLQEEQKKLQDQLAARQQAAATPSEITPDQAATLAATFLGQNDVYSIEMILISGVNTYQVAFSSGDVVFVSMNGQIIGGQGPTFGTYLNDNSPSDELHHAQTTTPEPHEDDDEEDDD